MVYIKDVFFVRVKYALLEENRAYTSMYDQEE